MRGITESRPLGQFAGEIWTDNFNDWTIMYIMRYCLAKYLNRKNLQEMNIQKIDLWRERDWNTSRVYEMFANTLSDDESEMSKLPMMQIVYNAFMQQNETHSSKNQFDISGNIVHSTLLEHGWEELNTNSYPIEQYLSKETRNITQVFINKKFEKCFIICNKTPTETWMSRLLSSLIKIFSWCFGEQYTQEELNVFKLLSQKEYDQAVELIDADFANLDVEKKINEMFLSKYGSLQIKSRICILEDKIETVHRKIAEYQNSISTKLVELEDCKFDLNTLLNTETDDTQIVN